ncbi:MAG: YiiX/YebB-like N1pC/P60 family cysteine hydrolase [Niabella sp.]
MQNYYFDSFQLKPGDELIAPKSGWDIIQHQALYIVYDHNGTHWIIHNNTHTGVSLISVNAFFNQVNKVNKVIPFAGTNAQRRSLVQGALLRIGTSYSLINYNCEHFITEIKSGNPRSKQASKKCFCWSFGCIIH